MALDLPHESLVVILSVSLDHWVSTGVPRQWVAFRLNRAGGSCCEKKPKVRNGWDRWGPVGERLEISPGCA